VTIAEGRTVRANGLETTVKLAMDAAAARLKGPVPLKALAVVQMPRGNVRVPCGIRPRLTDARAE
jgi:hypothetical protein